MKANILKQAAMLAIAGALAGYYTRKKLGNRMPDIGIAVIEDALAIGGGIIITALAAPAREGKRT